MSNLSTATRGTQSTADGCVANVVAQEGPYRVVESRVEGEWMIQRALIGDQEGSYAVWKTLICDVTRVGIIRHFADLTDAEPPEELLSLPKVCPKIDGPE